MKKWNEGLKFPFPRPLRERVPQHLSIFYSDMVRCDQWLLALSSHLLKGNNGLSYLFCVWVALWDPNFPSDNA